MLKSRAKGSTVQVDFVCGEVEFIVQAGIGMFMFYDSHSTT